VLARLMEKIGVIQLSRSGSRGCSVWEDGFFQHP